MAGSDHNHTVGGKKWAVEQGYDDAKRVCVMGDSYGGYATPVGLTLTPDEFACGVDMYGPSNQVTLIQPIPETNRWRP